LVCKDRIEDAPRKSLDMVKPAYKLWLETKNGYVFGNGALELLQKIQEAGTLSGAAEMLDMSYRQAWGIIKKIEKRIGKLLLHTRKGGRYGGGGAELTSTGRELIRSFMKIRNVFDAISEDELSWEGLSLKISARNRIEGEVVSVKKGDVAATVKIKVDIPCIITSFITREAVDDLGLKAGDRAIAVVKATEVMVSKEA
jgi:molybdate transport system regulatory protein